MMDEPHVVTSIDIDCLPSPAAMKFSAADAASRSKTLYHVLQDRHVPITATLAEGLADFETATFPASDPFWGRAYFLAGGSVGLHGKMGNTQAWSRLFAVFLQVVVEPILRDAAVCIGRALITTVGTRADVTQAAQINSASYKIEAAVNERLNDQHIMGQAFWIAAATTLLGRFRETPAGQSSPAARRGKAVPFLPDLNLAHLVYGLEPILQEDRSWTRNAPRSASRSKRLRVGIRPREGGVTGVQHSCRDTDIADALSSAFVLPKEIRLMKLLEEGFMIPRRPPYRRPDRDLLSMTFQRDRDVGYDAAALVKAAWIDATMRLRFLLANMAMGNSEVGFGHIRTTGTIASAVSAQIDQPKGVFNIMALEGAMRAQMVSMSSLVPSIFDTVVPLHEATRKTEPDNPKAAAQIQVRTACAAQAVAAIGVRKNTKSMTQPKMPGLDDYARVCLIDVAPRVVRGDETVVSDWLSNRKSIVDDYDLDKAQDLYLGRILCPNIIKSGAEFVLCSDDGTGEHVVEVMEDDTPQKAIAHTVGALSSWLITQNIRAIANG